MKLTRITIAALFGLCIYACNNTTQPKEATAVTTNNQPDIKIEAVSYTADTITAKGFVTYDANKQEKRPAVLIVHEWWGITEYVKSRATQLAELGYVAMVVDMYGNARTGSTPDEAMKLASPFYMNPQLTKSRLDAAIQKIKTFQQVDTSKIAAIGYCYGGFVVLNAAKLGADLKGVVSFHGNLSGAPVSKDLLKAEVLVLHGGADPLVPPAEVNAFKKSMDSISANYTFIAYPGALHAFTNPNSTETGKKLNLPIAYHAVADSSSWNEMKGFFKKIF